MLLESGLIELIGHIGEADPLVGAALDVALRPPGLPQEAYFEDQEINAVLDMSRTGARVIILVTVPRFRWLLAVRDVRDHVLSRRGEGT